ncbi:MAG: hypothetical protein ACRDD2_00580 [Sarcina sp.]
MIEFKNKLSELRYNAKFYKGNIIKSYKNTFTEDELNELVYHLSVKDDNFKKMKIKESETFQEEIKYTKWLFLGFSIFFILTGLLVSALFLIFTYFIYLIFFEYKKDTLSTSISDLPNNKKDLIDLHNGKYLKEDEKYLYSYFSLDFFHNEKLVYEYNLFKACTIRHKNNVTYFWKETHEVALIFLNNIEAITYTDAGITIKGSNYFTRYDGNAYYSYPYIFIPSYIENYDEILEKFKSLKINIQ